MPARISRRVRRRPAKFRIRKAPTWIDPYPQIPGTLPEKMVFAALRRRNIYFVFQGTWRESGVIGPSTLLQDVGFQPDFIVPEYKVIFDPFGDFAHSKPRAVGERFPVRVLNPNTGKLETVSNARSFTEQMNLEHIGRDALKAVYYRSLGFEFIHPWSTDVAKHGGDWVVDQSQNLRHPPKVKLDKVNLQYKALQGYRVGKYVGAGANAQALANSKRRRARQLVIRRRRS